MNPRLDTYSHSDGVLHAYFDNAVAWHPFSKIPIMPLRCRTRNSWPLKTLVHIEQYTRLVICCKGKMDATKFWNRRYRTFDWWSEKNLETYVVSNMSSKLTRTTYLEVQSEHPYIELFQDNNKMRAHWILMFGYTMRRDKEDVIRFILSLNPR